MSQVAQATSIDSQQVMTTFDRLITGPVGAQLEYQLLMPLSSTDLVGTSGMQQVAMVTDSMAAPIVLSMPLDVMAGYQCFQPFDTQNSRLIM